MSKAIILVAPKPKRSREDNLKIIAECNRLIEKLRRDRDQLPDGI